MKRRLLMSRQNHLHCFTEPRWFLMCWTNIVTSNSLVDKSAHMIPLASEPCIARLLSAPHAISPQTRMLMYGCPDHSAALQLPPTATGHHQHFHGQSLWTPRSLGTLLPTLPCIRRLYLVRSIPIPWLSKAASLGEAKSVYRFHARSIYCP